MASTIEQYIAKLSKAADNLDVSIRDIVLSHEGHLLSTVKLRLYQKSLDADLRPLGEYSEVTRKRKRKKGQISTRVTLRDTGAFYNSMFVRFQNDEIIIDARDPKTSELEFLWGEAILGLSISELEMFVDTILIPELETVIDFDDLDLGEL